MYRAGLEKTWHDYRKKQRATRPKNKTQSNNGTAVHQSTQSEERGGTKEICYCEEQGAYSRAYNNPSEETHCWTRRRAHTWNTTKGRVVLIWYNRSDWRGRGLSHNQSEGDYAWECGSPIAKKKKKSQLEETPTTTSDELLTLVVQSISSLRTELITLIKGESEILKGEVNELKKELRRITVSKIVGGRAKTGNINFGSLVNKMDSTPGTPGRQSTSELIIQAPQDIDDLYDWSN